MLTAAFAPQDQYPAAEFVGYPGGKFLEPGLDGLVVDVDLAGGIGDDQLVVCEEVQHVPGAGAWPVGGQSPDVSLVDRGVGADPGQQDPQAAGRDPAYLLVAAAGSGVLLEFLEQGLGDRGERGQPVQ